MRAIEFEPRAATPVLPERAFGIELALGTFDPEDEGPSRVVFGAWRFPDGATPAWIRAVAIDAASGHVFERTLPGEPAAQGAVSLDLFRHLGLPGGDRTWAVFLWAEGVASRLHFFRPVSPTSRRAFATFAGSTAIEPGDLELALVRGQLRASVFVPGRASGPLERAVVLLAATKSGVRVLREPVPGAANFTEWRFLVPRERLVPEGRAHVIAFAEDMISDVLLVPA
jgi:hypothetical protein